MMCPARKIQLTPCVDYSLIFLHESQKLLCSTSHQSRGVDLIGLARPTDRP